MYIFDSTTQDYLYVKKIGYNQYQIMDKTAAVLTLDELEYLYRIVKDPPFFGAKPKQSSTSN